MDFLKQFQGTLARLPQAQVATALTAVTAAACLYLAALITWQLVPVSQDNGPAWRPEARGAGTASTGGGPAIEGVASLRLFGNAAAKAGAAKPKQPVQRDLISDAPKTSLRILLTGLVASSIEERGIAIIESSGSQETYGIGDKIKGTNASLQEVYADRAIIMNQGRYETLMLDGVEYTREISSETRQLRQAPTQVDRRGDAEQSEALRQARASLLEDPGNITDYIAISPVRDKGELRGYRLNPGKNHQLFIDSGLKPGDLAVSLNGFDLTNMSEAMQVMGQLADLKEIAVMVEREGQLTEVLFALPSE